MIFGRFAVLSFNTQPPEGGWISALAKSSPIKGFNTQPPEGGWEIVPEGSVVIVDVSTHSRPKAAGRFQGVSEKRQRFQHTAARRRLAL